MKLRKRQNRNHTLHVAVVAALLALPADAREACGPSTEKRSAVILDVAADGVDVVASIIWSSEVALPAAARLVIRDATDGHVAEVAVVPDTTILAEELVAGALDDLEDLGPQLRAAIENDEDELLSDPFDFHVTLADCTPDAECRYELLGGIHTDGLLTTEAFREALESVPPGTGDVLGYLLANRPDLRSEIYSYAFELDSLDRRTGFSESRDCECAWMAAIARGPNRIDYTNQSGESAGTSTAGYDMPGGGHYIGAQTLDGDGYISAGGSMRYLAALTCQEVASWDPATVRIEKAPGAKLRLRFPVMASCQRLCPGDVVHDLWYQVDLQGEALGGDGFGSEGHAEGWVTYSVDGQAIVGSQPRIDVVGLPLAIHSDIASDTQTAMTPASEPTRASLVTAGWVGVDAKDPARSAYGFAELENTYCMSAEAVSKCAVSGMSFFARVPEVPCVSSFSKCGDGIRIQRWRPNG